jgi:hypothetical protein
MASIETIASGIAEHATYLDALTVPAGLERAADEPPRRPDRPCGEAP